MASRPKRLTLDRYDDLASTISANQAESYGWYFEGLPHPIRETSDDEHAEKGDPSSFAYRRWSAPPSK